MDGPLISQTAGEKHVPNMMIAQKTFEYDLEITKVGNSTESSLSIKKELIELIKLDEMTYYYESLCKKYEWSIDTSLIDEMKLKNTTKLEELENQQKDAKENKGETEVLDSQFAKARYLAQCGNWDESYASYQVILDGKKTGSGKKIDAMLERCRIALFNSDISKLKDFITEVKDLIDKGGDWDRRNRLKIYEAHYLLLCRDIKTASKLLLDCVATFTCVELCTYEKFMFYAILTSIMTLPRTDMKKKLVSNPQIASIIKEVDHMEGLLNSIYNCEYEAFFQNILKVHSSIEKDRYLGPHTNYILREYRILAYAQFLGAYKSVMLSSMATNFGITVPLLDTELARFIAAGRLDAKIDKVGDVVLTVRPEKKSAQYQEIIKKGDVLLNNIQRLARVLDA